MLEKQRCLHLVQTLAKAAITLSTGSLEKSTFLHMHSAVLHWQALFSCAEKLAATATAGDTWQPRQTLLSL